MACLPHLRQMQELGTWAPSPSLVLRKGVIQRDYCGMLQRLLSVLPSKRTEILFRRPHVSAAQHSTQHSTQHRLAKCNSGAKQCRSERRSIARELPLTILVGRCTAQGLSAWTWRREICTGFLAGALPAMARGPDLMRVEHYCEQHLASVFSVRGVHVSVYL
jgi:hypothetical protein